MKNRETWQYRSNQLRLTAQCRGNMFLPILITTCDIHVMYVQCTHMWTKIHCTYFVSMSLANMPSLHICTCRNHSKKIKWFLFFSLLSFEDGGIKHDFVMVCPGHVKWHSKNLKKYTVNRLVKSSNVRTFLGDDHYTLRSVTVSGHVKCKRNSLACKIQEDSAGNSGDSACNFIFLYL